MNKRLSRLVLGFLRSEYDRTHPEYVLQLNPRMINRFLLDEMDKAAEAPTNRNRAKRARKAAK